MTHEQAQATLNAHGARYVTKKGQIEWWKANDGSWIAKSVHLGGVVLQKLPGNACGC